MDTKDLAERIKRGLEYYKSLSIKDVKIEDLKDIRDIQVDTSRPVVERILSFMVQIGNPYLFKVEGISVKVSFKDDGPTLQECLELFFCKI